MTQIDTDNDMEGGDGKKILKNINGDLVSKEKITLDFLERMGFGFHVFGL